jgi:hypothetical protein
MVDVCFVVDEFVYLFVCGHFRNLYDQEIFESLCDRKIFEDLCDQVLFGNLCDQEIFENLCDQEIFEMWCDLDHSCTMGSVLEFRIVIDRGNRCLPIVGGSRVKYLGRQFVRGGHGR